MKKQLIVVALLAATLSATAQEKPKTAGAQSYIGITGGASIPTGNFAKGDYLDNKSGYAGTGGNVGITGVYFLPHSRFGIAALVSFQGYGFTGAQSIADGLKDGYAIDSATLTTNGSNHAINVFVGPYYSIPVAPHFKVDVRVLGGLTSAHMAGYRVGFEDGDYDVTQLESSATAFGFQIGIAPRYNFGKHLSLMLNLDYFAYKPKFNIGYTSFHPGSGTEEAGVNNPPGNKALPATYNETLSGINTNLTLAWRF